MALDDLKFCEGWAHAGQSKDMAVGGDCVVSPWAGACVQQPQATLGD
jgi:hypothetical protein